MNTPNKSTELLSFWFAQENHSKWFSVDANFDHEISSRFYNLYNNIEAEFDYSTSISPEEILSAIIVLDQLPRNMFRGSAKAFATDDKALLITKKAIDDLIDRQLSAQYQHFLYMPLMHSENLLDQELSLKLFSNHKQVFEHAKSHHDVIKRFGRFPQRNNILGRVSTKDELAFLNEK
jgi:uncharacterized protein (DUF924 family)